MTQSLNPFDSVPTDAEVAAMPKVDLHVHGESAARLDQIEAQRMGESPYDWRKWGRYLLEEVPAGLPRLAQMNGELNVEELHDLDSIPANIVARIAAVLKDAANDGAILVEVRLGGGTRLRPPRPDLMALFREAERRIQRQFPRLRAEASLGFRASTVESMGERMLDAYREAAAEGLGGVDLLLEPYSDPDWETIHSWCQRAADAGLGITVHVGEFSREHLAAALELPGLSRLGHAVQATSDPVLLDLIRQKGVTIECCLTSNVVYGATNSYAEHPIRRFTECGIPVTLATDDPVRVATTIGREYAIARALGFSPADLLRFTRNGVEAAFTSRERREGMLKELASG